MRGVTPPPFYSGSTIVAADTGAMLRFTNPSRTSFEAPPRTAELFLPRATLVDVEALGERGDACAALQFTGSFDDVSRPAHVTLAPLSGDDAVSLAETLRARLGLPLVPVVRRADQLHEGAPPPGYVVATGEYREVRDQPNFGTVRLSGALFLELLQRPLEPGVYRVTGFYEPGLAPASALRPTAGYVGPRLMVIAMEPVA